MLTKANQLLQKSIAINTQKLIQASFSTGQSNSKQFMGHSDEQITNLKNINEFDLLDHINNRFDSAGKSLGIKPDLVQFYRTCDQLVRFQLPLIRENGDIEQILAYRVIHKTHKLPAKGGLRINRYSSARDLEALALQNALRAAIFDIPLGGSKGLIKINPYKYTERERQLLIKRYTIELAKKNLIGPSIDLIGPALGTGAKEMNWIKDTYQNFFGQDDVNSIAVCTGKSVNNFGIEGGAGAQAYGLVFSMAYLLGKEDFCKRHNLEGGLKGKTYTLQSFGNMGYWTAKFMSERGAKLVGVLEYEGSLYNPDGINVEDLRQHMLENDKSIKNFKGAEYKSDDSAMDVPVDIYIPCYTENTIHKENQQRLNVKMIAEGCNHPITPIGGQLLRDRGIFVFPDLIVNAGGVICSYFEWIKNLSHTSHGLLTKRWEQKSKLLLLDVIKNITGLDVVKSITPAQLSQLQGAREYDVVISGLEEYLVQAIDKCVQVSHDKNIPLRQATYVVGIEKIHEHYQNVGISFSR